MRIFVDMDGVLCDWCRGVWDLWAACEFGPIPSEYHNPPCWPWKQAVGEWDMYKHPPMNLTTNRVAKFMSQDFYANLEWMSDGMELLNRCEKIAPTYLLTSPWHTEGSREGKFAWVEKHIPRYMDRLIIATCKEVCARPGAVLFDDSDKNCGKWALHGGQAVLVPRPWNCRHMDSCKTDGHVWDLNGLFKGVYDGETAITPTVPIPIVSVGQPVRHLGSG